MKKKRCEFKDCNKKIPFALDFKCRCEKVFCSIHKDSVSHECSFDYKSHYKEILEKENQPVIASKIEQLGY